MLPEAMQLELKEAMIAEYALELDDRIAQLHRVLPKVKHPRKKPPVKVVVRRPLVRRTKKRGLVAAE